MFEKTIETSATPHLTISAGLGNVSIQGEDAPQVQISSDAEVALEQTGESLALEATGNCRITCPADSTITLEIVRGNLRISNVKGSTAIGTVNGNVRLRDGGPADLDTVHGSLGARRLEGDLKIGTVHGDARVQQVEGTVTVTRVGSDLNAGAILGGVVAPDVGSDARLTPPFTPETTYKVKAGSDVLIHLPEEADVRLSLSARTDVHTQVPDLELTEENGRMTGQLGEGAALIEAEAGSDVLILPEGARESFEFDFSFLEDLEGIGTVVEARVEEALSEIEERLNSVDSERLQLRIEQATEKAMRAAERAADRVRREAEREAQRARIRAERAERRWKRASGRKSAAKETPQATEEERMRVLRMVEEGKITPEQAAELLSALGV